MPLPSLRGRVWNPQSVIRNPQSLLLCRHLLFLILNNGRELFRGRSTGEDAPVDDHGGCRVHANAVCFLDIVTHKLFCSPLVHARVEIPDVEPDGGRVAFEVWAAVDFSLIHEQLIGIFPELPLFPRAFGGVGGQAGGWMHLLREA